MILKLIRLTIQKRYMREGYLYHKKRAYKVTSEQADMLCMLEFRDMPIFKVVSAEAIANSEVPVSIVDLTGGVEEEVELDELDEELEELEEEYEEEETPEKPEKPAVVKKKVVKKKVVKKKVVKKKATIKSKAAAKKSASSDDVTMV